MEELTPGCNKDGEVEEETRIQEEVEPAPEELRRLEREGAEEAGAKQEDSAKRRR